jgi:two-component system cell cycle sensor histidine kinase/response regulator CckA
VNRGSSLPLILAERKLVDVDTPRGIDDTRFGSRSLVETFRSGNRFLLTAILCLICGSVTAQTPPPNVVILDSYHNGYAWSDNELTGLKERLAEKYPSIDPPVEYLDAKRFPDQDHLRTVGDYLIRKYGATKVDLVITLDNPALDMLLQRGKELFPGAPIVFAGYNGFSPQLLADHPKVTGIAEADDIAGTLQLALSLFPQAKKVFVISDATATGIATAREVQAIAPAFANRLEFTAAPALSFSELAVQIASLPSDALVLLLAFTTDRDGLTLPMQQSTTLLTSNAQVPVFTVLEPRLGFGTIGGSLVSGRDHGRAAGNMALRVLSGDDPSWIPVIQEVSSRPMFDYRILSKFNVPLSALSPGSVVINRPENFMEKYQSLVLGALAVFAVLFSLIVGLSATIVRRRRAERELAKSRTRIRAILNATGDLIIATDANRIITDCNSRIEPLFGYAPQEVVGHSMEILHLSSERFRRMADVALPIIDREGSWRGEWEYRNKQGETVATEVTLTALKTKDGKPSGYVAVIRDIRERRRAQDTLRQAEEKLRQALKMEAIGRLAGGVAHDFNNLLTVIKGYGDLVIEKVGSENPIYAELQEIVRAAQQASMLTAQLLAFSRKQVFQPKSFDLNALVSELAKMLRRLIGEDIELSTSLARSPMSIKADPGQIEQVIMNLAMNARDAMPQGGKLFIQTEEAELPDSIRQEHPDSHPGRYVTLVVKDTGRGMDKETLSHLFEPFYSTKEKGRGTGLGLSTVYGIVIQSEGHITCQSARGRGTSFTIFLPLREAGADRDKAPAGDGEPLGGSESILLVEDEEAVRKFVKSTLNSRGFSVRDTSNGKQALQLISDGETWPNLVITDVIMPKMSGKQLAERIRRFLPHTKILFISGYTGGATDVQDSEPDVSPLLQKPFGPEELVRKVRSVLDGE